MAIGEEAQPPPGYVSHSGPLSLSIPMEARGPRMWLLGLVPRQCQVSQVLLHERQ